MICKNFWCVGIIVLSTAVVFVVLRMVLLRWEKKHHKPVYIRQLWQALVVFIGLLLIILLFPTEGKNEEELKTQVIGIIGIVLSGAIALSSTTFLGNAIAGLMNRITDNYRLGNFLMVKEYFGRVTNRSVFHVEIQTPERNLISIPNLFMSTHPVEIYRPSGTLITTTVSLGYEVSHQEVKKLLIQAAEQVELEEPFVYITELGDFSIVYKVNGLLKEVSKMISVKSRLHEAMLDLLHQHQIEIVSPSFMNQRQVNDTTFIPQTAPVDPEIETIVPEELMFDKAERASNLEELKNRQKELDDKMLTLEESLEGTEGEEARSSLEKKISTLKRYKQRLEGLIEEAKESLKNEE